ncbi:hypothetical protein ACFSTA_03570 [Ornithinibacillus salinisoli]|uniref:Uncharacterized protein n=1 Tax=Ornithinibacillus salinisoli TaxID=1848459 RepID=A0ABW4VY37_9BACI
MELLFAGIVVGGIFAIYDALRRVNLNLLTQTDEIKKLREEIKNQK